MRFDPTRFHPELRIGGFSFYDGTLAFYLRVNALIPRDGTLLDVGCGRGAYLDNASGMQRELRSFETKCRQVIGIDVDPSAAANPALTEFRLIEGGRDWPIESESVDVIVADWVIEHISDPESFLREAFRTLRPGGTICIRTANAWNYAYAISRLIPNRFHRLVLGFVQKDRAEQDSFPTLYRCNTRHAMTRSLKMVGLEPVVVLWDAEPGYLAFSALTYRLGLALSRISPSGLKNTLLAFGTKPLCSDAPG